MHLTSTLIHDNIVNIAFFTCKYEGAFRSLLYTPLSIEMSRLIWSTNGRARVSLNFAYQLQEPCGMSTSSFDTYLKTATSTVNAWTYLFDAVSPSRAI